MRQKRMAALALAALLLLPANGLAASLSHQQVVENISGLDLSSGTYVQRVGTDNRYAVFSAAGEQLSAAYGQIELRQDMPYDIVVSDPGGMNARGLVDAQGREVIPPVYGDIRVPGERWILAGRLADWGTIGSTDVYFDGVKIGTLSAEECGYSTYFAAHGAYLGVSGGQAGFYLNSRFERVAGIADYFVTDEYFYDWRDGCVYHPATGQKAFDPSCTLTADEVERAVWYSDNGDFIDLRGNVVSSGPSAGKKYNNVEYRGGGYMLVRSNDGAGIADMQGSEVVPALYTSLGGGGETKHFFAAGYQAVMRDGKLSWLDTEGNVTAAVPYTLTDGDCMGFHVNGLFIVTRSLGETVVFTATAGELPQRYEDAMAVNAPTQRLLTVKLGGLWGAIDMDGNTVIPFEHESQLQISYDGTAALGTNTQHQQVLYAISYGDEAAPAATTLPAPEATEAPELTDAPEAASPAITDEPAADPTASPAESAPADDGWDCPTCGQHNLDLFVFCPVDGTARPEEPPACVNCGFVMPDGSTPNFCPICGQAFQ